MISETTSDWLPKVFPSPTIALHFVNVNKFLIKQMQERTNVFTHIRKCLLYVG